MSLRRIADRLGLTVEEFEEFTERPRLNISISEIVPVVKSIDGRRRIANAELGFLAPWDNSKRIFNAAAETIARKITFRESFKCRRCLIPADGFYEWPNKRQTLIHFSDDRPFCFAGLWLNNTMTMITCAPNDFMRPIHRRMPAILRDRDCGIWLDPQSPIELLHSVVATRPWDNMKSTAVSTPESPNPTLFPE